MLGKTNAGTKSGGGGSSVAEYVYKNTTEEVEFPREAMTGTEPWYFKKSESKFYAYDGEFAISDMGNNAQKTWMLFDNNLTTKGYFSNVNVGNSTFGFKDKVMLSKIKMITETADTITVKGFNAQDEAQTVITTFETISDKSNYQEFSVPTNSYRYFRIESSKLTTVIFEARLYVIKGNTECTLSSTNMTPQIKAYPRDYMRFVTQTFANGSEIVPSKELILKPYEDGGNLIGYTDNGSAVNLKMYLLTGDGKEALYILSVDDTFTKPDGYTTIQQVADMNIPAHMYFNGEEWVMGQ